MTETKTGEQSIRQAARQAAVAAQARRRAKAAERDKRLDAADRRHVAVPLLQQVLQHRRVAGRHVVVLAAVRPQVEQLPVAVERAVSD